MQQIWEDYYKSHNYFHLEPHEALESFTQKCEDRQFGTVLDLGCGAGSDLLFMAEKGFEVTGVDFSPSAATNAEDLLQSKNLPGKVFVDNLFDKVTTFASKEFPAIVAINSLEFTDMNTFKSTLSQIAKILNDRGLFLLVVSSTESPVDVMVTEQLFFDQDELSSILEQRFAILDFMRDEEKNLVFVLEKLNHAK